MAEDAAETLMRHADLPHISPTGRAKLKTVTALNTAGYRPTHLLPHREMQRRYFLLFTSSIKRHKVSLRFSS